MGNQEKTGLKWLNSILIALALLSPLVCASQDTNDFSWLELIPPGCCLDSWSFDETNLYSDLGFAPLSVTNVEQVLDWDGEALQVDNTDAVWLTYSILQNAPGYGEYTNLTLDTGTIEFWFIPNWESADTNFYGSGPVDFARLIEVGAWTTNGASDWWSLYLNPNGSGIYFSSGTNGVRTNYLSAPISWDWNTWHMIDLAYSPTNTAIYIDGQMAATGSGVRYVPSGDVLTNGFAIGSDLATGMQQAHGQFDDLATYNYQLSPGDITDDYGEVYPELPGTFHPMDDEPPPPPGGGGGDGGSGGGGSYMPNYGNNLWVAVLGMTNDTLSLLETNTISDVLYELQGCTNLISPNWVSFRFATGAELTNCTPTTAPVSQKGNMFFRIRSWQGVDGIPFWWFLTYLGQDTNVSGEMFAPSGDGWTLLQCFDNGINPTNWVTPPAPQGLTITGYNTNGTATLTWMLSAGPVLGYIVQTPNGTNIVGSGESSYTDNSSSSSATYSIQAIYGGGHSAWSPSVSVEDFENARSSPPVSANNILSASIVGGPLGSAYLAVSAIPTNTASLQLSLVDYFGLITNLTVPVSDPTNGFYSVPNFEIPVLNYGQGWYATAEDTNNNPVSSSIFAGGGYMPQEGYYDTQWVVPPYFDGRTAMKQNLIFLLRAANKISPIEFEYAPPWDGPYQSLYSYPTNYVYEGFYDTLYPYDFDVFEPFEENYLYCNFIFNPMNVDSSGEITSGPTGSSFPINMNEPTTFGFNYPATNDTAIPAVLSTNDTQWLCSYPPDGLDYSEMGIGSSHDSGTNYYFSMTNNVPNYFGLPFTSATIAWGSESGDYTVLSAGSTVAGPVGYFYPATAWPKFQTLEYDFWKNPGAGSYPYPASAYTTNVPGTIGFSTSYTNSLMIASVGDSSFQAVCYAKLAVNNAYPGVDAYLGQYFTNAYQIDNSGNVTSNLAGMLSPYGNFFATEPGQAALVTMPDPDTGQQGTDVVDLISLNVDANHDGTMDFNFTGPDFVGPNNPHRFWVNDDQDAGDDDGDGIPGQPASTADGYNFASIGGSLTPHYYIHGTRDLVDYFPVYVNIGSLFVSNSLSAGINYADTNWQFVLSQSDEVLRFAYTDLTPTNYLNYLRDTNEARLLGGFPGLASILPGAQLITISNVTDGGAPLSPSFIASIATNSGGIILVEAATNTTQPLVLTVYHGTNEIAQTQLYLSISGVEQMFRHKNILLNPQPNEVPDRLTDADVPNEPPTNDKNFIFVHGYNVNATQARGWDSDYFKRLYWSGSHAKFYGVTWESADSQKADAVTINLETNIVNAFNTAPLLNNFVNGLSGTNIIASHSLGNILVLSTLSDCTNRNINSYFMVDAALAIEAIDTSAAPNPDMYPSAWASYGTDLWASYWHGLFPADDYRSTLTWWGRLTNFQNAAVYNFYSSGEEVLRDYSTDPPTGLLGIAAGQLVSLWEGDTGLYTWAWQEKLKGLMPANGLLSSDHGGWQFNQAYGTNITVGDSPYWEPMSPSAAAGLNSTQLQTNAFFNFASGGLFSFNNDLALETSGGSSYAQANRNRILSDAIPCLTLPVGANPVPRLTSENRNYDEQAEFENGWPADRNSAEIFGATAAGEWRHSDNRAVAYTFTYKLFNQMVALGNLQ